MGEFPARRIVLVPAPFQGHITPMMQLAQTLHSKGFSITVAQTKFNSFGSSNIFPDFCFFTIPNSLSESDFKELGLLQFLFKLNDACETSFEICLDQSSDEIFCVVYDEFMSFSAAAAKRLKIPSIIFSTSNAATWVCRNLLAKSKAKYLGPLIDSGSQEKPVQDLHPFRIKDLPSSAFGSVKESLQLFEKSSDVLTSSAIILNTTICLESPWLELLNQEHQIPVFPVGPLHVTASSMSTSLLEEDTSCIEWLDNQMPNSVLYVSFGSLALMQKKELDEMARGLANSKQPFLWVVRPGSIPGFEWIEWLPEGFSSVLESRGRILKWAPQKRILRHQAVGGFWSHCGWNSTLESIAEGVPMICRPFSGDQKVNARLLSCIWGIGLQVEGDLERVMVERAVRRMMVEEEGEVMRKMALSLKDKVEASVKDGGSSTISVGKLSAFLLSF